MNFNNSISIDEAKFSKSSKKLHNILNELGLDIKLSQTQEIFSQSLGLEIYIIYKKHLHLYLLQK